MSETPQPPDPGREPDGAGNPGESEPEDVRSRHSRGPESGMEAEAGACAGAGEKAAGEEAPGEACQDDVPAAAGGQGTEARDAVPAVTCPASRTHPKHRLPHAQHRPCGCGSSVLPAWARAVRPEEPPAPMRMATGLIALTAGLLAALLLPDGVGVDLLIVAAPVTLAACAPARAAGRRPRSWTVAWGAGALALLIVPALRDAAWPGLLAILAASALGSLALHGGGATWRGALLGSLGLVVAVVPAAAWGWHGLRHCVAGARDRWWRVVRTAVVALGLLAVFGVLFAGADAAFADLLGGLLPNPAIADGPLRVLLFALGLLVALAVARTAAAPWWWDRIEATPGRALGRAEWALPLLVLNLLFAAFNTVQVTILFGGDGATLRETGLSYAAYARQGFWQLLAATLLVLVVLGFALRWAPHGRQNDGILVRTVLGALCLLTLIVVVSALRRMELYVDAYGLTRLRLSVAGVELWLGLVIVLITVAVARGATSPVGRGAWWLPRAVAVSAAAAVLCFGLLSPDRLIADQNVARYDRTGTIDLPYLRSLSADAAPALDSLPEPQRSCALGGIVDELEAEQDEPWYATSYGELRARTTLEERPLSKNGEACVLARAGGKGGGHRAAG